MNDSDSDNPPQMSSEDSEDDHSVDVSSLASTAPPSSGISTHFCTTLDDKYFSWGPPPGAGSRGSALGGV